MEVVTAKLLRKNPVERYQTLPQLKSDLELIAGGKDVLPVYLSRGTKNARTAEAGVPGKDPALPQSGHFRLLFASGLAALIVIGALSYYFLFPSQGVKMGHGARPIEQGSDNAYRVPGPAETQSKVPGRMVRAWPDTSRAEKSRPGYLDGKTLYAGLVSRDGKAFRHWSLPKGQPTPIIFEIENGGSPQVAELSGDIYIPVSARVCAILQKAILDRAEVLDALIDCTLDEIDLQAFSRKEVEEIVPHLAGIRSIRALRIGNSRWSLADGRAGVACINSFAGLDGLHLFTVLEAQSLLKVRRVKLLKEFSLQSDSPFVPDSLKAFGGSQCLQSLSILLERSSAREVQMVAA
jgi:hypothetical protein